MEGRAAGAARLFLRCHRPCVPRLISDRARLVTGQYQISACSRNRSRNRLQSLLDLRLQPLLDLQLARN